MERRGVWLGVGALALVVIGTAVFMARGEEGTGDALRPVEGAGPGAASPLAEGSTEPAGEAVDPQESPRAMFGGDGGVSPRPLRPVRVHAERLEQAQVRRMDPPGTPNAQRIQIDRNLHRSGTEGESERTTGWRLGQTRSRLALITARIDQLGTQADQLEEDGRPEDAARQRRVIERMSGRQAELQTDVNSLAARAEADGTAGDEEQGFADGPLQRSTTPATRPARP